MYKGYTDEKTGSFQCANRIISNEDAQNFIKANNLEYVDLYYLLIGMNFSNGDSGNRFLKGNIDSAIVSSQDGISKYAFSLQMGKYPTNNNEVCVTDYLLYNIYIISPYLISDKLGWNNLDKISDFSELRGALKNFEEDNFIEIFGSDWRQKIEDDSSLKKIQANPGLLLMGSEIEFSEGDF